MLEDSIYMDMDAYDSLKCNYVIDCKTIRLKDDKIDIELKNPDCESLPKRIVINGCEYIMKEEK